MATTITATQVGYTNRSLKKSLNALNWPFAVQMTLHSSSQLTSKIMNYGSPFAETISNSNDRFQTSVDQNAPHTSHTGLDCHLMEFRRKFELTHARIEFIKFDDESISSRLDPPDVAKSLDLG